MEIIGECALHIKEERKSISYEETIQKKWYPHAHVVKLKVRGKL